MVLPIALGAAIGIAGTKEMLRRRLMHEIAFYEALERCFETLDPARVNRKLLDKSRERLRFLIDHGVDLTGALEVISLWLAIALALWFLFTYLGLTLINL